MLPSDPYGPSGEHSLVRGGVASSILTPLFLVAHVILAAPAGAQDLPAQTWPMYQFGSDRNAVFNSPGWDVQWSANLGAKVNGGLSVVSGTLFVETFDGKLQAFDAQKGATLWTQSLDNVAMNAPIVANGVVITGTGTSRRLSENELDVVIGRPEGDSVEGFNVRTGARIWRFATIGEDMPTGVLATVGDRPAFIFSNGDAHVYALDPANGGLIWKRPIPGESTMSSLALYNGVVYGLSDVLVSTPYVHRVLDPLQWAGLENYRYTWALDPQLGQFRWLGRFGYTDCSPAIGDGILMDETAIPTFGNPDTGYNIVYAADAATGRMLWKYQTAVGDKPLHGSDELAIAGVYSQGTFYESLPYTKELVAFDGHTGRVLWRVKTQEAVKMSAVVEDGTLYVGDTGGYFYAVRTSDGQVLRSVKFSHAFTTSPPVIVGNTLYVVDESVLYAMRLTDILNGAPIE